MNILPQCPQCSSMLTYEDEELYICPECAHEWSRSTSVLEQKQMIRDAYGTELKSGDTITIVKDLKVKGTSSVVKVGTKVKIIRLIEEGDHNIDCKIEGIGPMQLKSEFVKKA